MSSTCSSNRVAGIELANVNNIVVQSCRLDSNGLSGDTGTGYGFATQSGTEAQNIKVMNNSGTSNITGESGSYFRLQER